MIKFLPNWPGSYGTLSESMTHGGIKVAEQVVTIVQYLKLVGMFVPKNNKTTVVCMSSCMIVM